MNIENGYALQQVLNELTFSNRLKESENVFIRQHDTEHRDKALETANGRNDPIFGKLLSRFTFYRLAKFASTTLQRPKIS